MKNATIIVLPLLFGGSCALSDTSTKCDMRITHLVEAIDKERSVTKRGDLAEDLANLMTSDPTCVDASERSLDLLIDLLGDRDDSVRWGAAKSLSIFGPRAKRAVPALLKALELYRNEQWPSPVLTQTSKMAICEALQNITGKAWPECEY